QNTLPFFGRSATPFEIISLLNDAPIAAKRKRVSAQPQEMPGWFSDKNKRKTTPSASASVASRNFLDDADTPPCGNARRGVTLDSNFSQLLKPTRLHTRPAVGLDDAITPMRNAG